MLGHSLDIYLDLCVYEHIIHNNPLRKHIEIEIEIIDSGHKQFKR